MLKNIKKYFTNCFSYEEESMFVKNRFKNLEIEIPPIEEIDESPRSITPKPIDDQTPFIEPIKKQFDTQNMMRYAGLYKS